MDIEQAFLVIPVGVCLTIYFLAPPEEQQKQIKLIKVVKKMENKLYKIRKFAYFIQGAACLVVERW